jgi:hypothetical protein
MNEEQILENRILAKVALRFADQKHPIVNFTDSRVLEALFENYPSGSEGFKFLEKGYRFKFTEGQEVEVVKFWIDWYGPIHVGMTKYGINSTLMDGTEEKDTNLTINVVVKKV